MSPPRAPVDPLTGLEAARLGVYVHFPYCLSKCPYCDFASIAARQVPEARYADAIMEEQRLRLLAFPALEGREVHSVYLGGGTPSLWHPSFVARVLRGIADRVRVARGAEVTLEANPGASDASRFAGYREAGVNRLSIGVQSFQPETLRFLGRGHDAAEAEAAYESARRAGFSNVSLDLIYGVPGQSSAQARSDAERAAALGPEHLSAYALTLDKESLAEEVPLARQLARGEVALPPDEEVIAMQRGARDAFLARGLERYEISNYARPGYHSRHNALYWTGGEYLALGTGATGFLRTGDRAGVRYSNLRSAEKWFQAVERGELPDAGVERLSSKELMEERIAMGLRLSSGVDLEGVCAEFEEDFRRRSEIAEALLARGLLERRERRWVLTDAGADLHSAISARLM
ncbi:MAG TPA: radical SAM family heme chaperone HemW [Myxococcaceae bacterium]|nr:radical SAM family heme chaperone HemW [Myxococcaceae bacterium]